MCTDNWSELFAELNGLEDPEIGSVLSNLRQDELRSMYNGVYVGYGQNVSPNEVEAVRIAVRRVAEMTTGHYEWACVISKILARLGCNTEGAFRESSGPINYNIFPYAYDVGQLTENQTYSIGLGDFNRCCTNNPGLRMITYPNVASFGPKGLIWTNGTVCRFNERYVVDSVRFQDFIPTEYALSHMHECALKFNRVNGVLVNENIDEFLNRTNKYL